MNIPKVIAIWLDLADIAPARFVGVPSPPDAIDPHVLADSRVWAIRFFLPEVNPHNTADARYSFQLSDGKSTADMLRMEWTAKGLELEALETAAFLVVRIRKGLQLPTTPAEVERTARQVLNMSDRDHTWTLKYPASLTEGVWFSTNPDADLDSTHSWRDRLDGAIRGGKVEFVCFKKYEQRGGLRSADKWFSDDFRAAHHGVPIR